MILEAYTLCRAFLKTFSQLWKVESLGRKGWQWLCFYRPRLGSNGGGYVYDLKRGRSRQFQPRDLRRAPQDVSHPLQNGLLRQNFLGATPDTVQDQVYIPILMC